ncbi:MAG: tRNA 2-thiouridine(34) synthase MnmA, partial [Candidatus Geothermincolia bacterium]
AVTGATMRLWVQCEADAMAARRSCCSLEDIEDAAAVARSLGVPHLVIDMRQRFLDVVIDRFLSEYRAGRTPNPCIRCNAELKFSDLVASATRAGMDRLATGHYARIEERDGVFRLLKASDARKDQSYVLYMLDQRSLARVLLPLGSMSKGEVVELSRRLSLPVTDKPESQDVCFLAGNDYRRFLEERIPEAFTPGPIIDSGGRRLGEHAGIAAYTVGQRRGIRVSAPNPLYVIGIDTLANTVIVGAREEAASRSLIAGDVSWVSGTPPAGDIRAQVKTRYRMTAVSATVTLLAGGHIRVDFDTPAWAVAPGQAAVVYDGDEVLGGGTIISSKR